MKVLMVIENYLPHIGGVEVVFRNLAEGLVRKGHSVTIVTHRLKKSRSSEEINGVKIHRVSCLHSRYLFSFFSIPKVIALAKEADIIHTTTFNGAFPAWVASKLLHKKCVITVHEAWIGKWKQYTDMNWLQAMAHELLERMIYLLQFDKYAAVSNSTRQQLLSIGKSKEKTATVYNAVDYEHFNPEKCRSSKVRKKYGLEKSFVCLTYGRPGPSKGIEYAIKAIPLIKVPNMKYVLMLSKDRQYMERHRQMLKLIKKLSIEGKTVLVEPVSHEELPSYIMAADCVVVPSLSEGFGYTAAEAAAMGKPVVATNTTSLPEVVSGKYLLVKPKSSSEIAAAVEKICKGRYDKSPLKKFLIKDNVNSYLRIYEELVSKP